MVLSGLISLRQIISWTSVQCVSASAFIAINATRTEYGIRTPWYQKDGQKGMAGDGWNSNEIKQLMILDIWLNFLLNTGYLIFVGTFKPNSCAATTTYYKICGLAAYLSQFQPVVGGWEQQSQTAKETRFQKIGCRSWSKFQGDRCLNPNKTHGMCWWNYHIDSYCIIML